MAPLFFLPSRPCPPFSLFSPLPVLMNYDVPIQVSSCIQGFDRIKTRSYTSQFHVLCVPKPRVKHNVRTEIYLGVNTIPSYSLLLIISRVWWKCFLLLSTEAESCWLPARLEWMSSMSPLRYLVVT